MPYTPINFANIEPIKYGNMFSDILGAYKQKEAAEDRSLKNEGIKHENTIQGAKASRAPEMEEETIRKIRGSNQYQELLNALKEQYGAREVEAAINEKNSSADWHKAQAANVGKASNSQNFMRLPANVKTAMLAQAKGFGMDESEAAKLLNQGTTLDEIKEMQRTKGVDVDNARPIYNPTTATLTANQQKGATAASQNVLSKHLTDAKKPYIRTLAGVSPALVWAQIEGGDPDKVAKFLAARGLENDQAMLAITESGGRVSAHAVNDMVKKALGDQTVFSPLVSPEVYEKASNYMREWLNEAVLAADDYVNNIKPNNFSQKLKEGRPNITELSPAELDAEINALSKGEK